MAYKKTTNRMTRRMAPRRTPLMFGGPTPVNMAPAMAGMRGCFGEYVAVAGAVGDYIAVGDDILHEDENGSTIEIGTPSGAPVQSPPIAARDEIQMPAVYHEGLLGKVSKGTALMLVGAAVLAYVFLKKKRS